MIRLIQRILILFFAASVVLFALSLWKNAGIQDDNGPEITMDNDSIQISVTDDTSAILDGVSAADKKDGDVSDTLVVEGLSNFIEKGRRQATIAAFDSDNNVTKITREVVYTDYRSPHFALEAPLRFDMNSNDSLLKDVTASDILDGDLTGSITMKAAGEQTAYVGASSGEYPYIFSVINSAGDVVDLSVTIDFYDSSEDNSCPKALLSDYLIYVKKGTKVQPWDYVEGVSLYNRTLDMDDLEENESADDNAVDAYTKNDIHISNNVDSQTPGTYEVIYSMDGEDGYASKVRLIVVVEE